MWRNNRSYGSPTLHSMPQPNLDSLPAHAGLVLPRSPPLLLRLRGSGRGPLPTPPILARPPSPVRRTVTPTVSPRRTSARPLPRSGRSARLLQLNGPAEIIEIAATDPGAAATQACWGRAVGLSPPAFAPRRTAPYSLRRFRVSALTRLL